MSGEDSDKTEEPTEHKLQEARKKGQIFKSQEITSTIMLFATFGVLASCGKWMFTQVLVYATQLWGRMDDWTDMKNINMFGESLAIVILFLKVMAPLLGTCLVAGVLGNIAQIGYLFSTEPLKPSLSKINPLQGFKKIFSMKSVIELVKQLMKLVIIGWIVYQAVKTQLGSLTTLVEQPLTFSLVFTKGIAVDIIKKTIIGMLIVSAVDYIFQKKNFMKEMKMSMQELKDEYKDTEGNPQVKAKMRQLMRQAGQQAQAAAAAVPKSTAVVTNPTHFAVALRYEPGVDQAPMVTCKGEDRLAFQIKILAEDNDVPIIENVELARALFGACEPGQPIPPDMYKATAEVLAYVFKLKKRKMAKKARASKTNAAAAAARKRIQSGGR